MAKSAIYHISCKSWGGHKITIGLLWPADICWLACTQLPNCGRVGLSPCGAEGLCQVAFRMAKTVITTSAVSFRSATKAYKSTAPAFEYELYWVVMFIQDMKPSFSMNLCHKHTQKEGGIQLRMRSNWQQSKQRWIATACIGIAKITVWLPTCFKGPSATSRAEKRTWKICRRIFKPSCQSAGRNKGCHCHTKAAGILWHIACIFPWSKSDFGRHCWEEGNARIDNIDQYSMCWLFNASLNIQYWSIFNHQLMIKMN